MSVSIVSSMDVSPRRASSAEFLLANVLYRPTLSLPAVHSNFMSRDFVTLGLRGFEYNRAEQFAKLRVKIKNKQKCITDLLTRLLISVEL